MSGANTDYIGTVEINEGKIKYTKADKTENITDSYFSGVTEINTDGTLEMNITENKIEEIKGNIQSTSQGSGTLEKTGQGTLKLTGDNSNYTGLVDLQEGKILFEKTDLNAQIDNYFGGITQISENTELELNIAENKELTINGNIESKTPTSGTITKTGEGTLKLTSDNSKYTGLTQIQTGKIIFDKLTTQDAYFGGTTQIEEMGTLEMNIESDYTTDWVLLGTGNFEKTGAATLTLNGDNIGYTGEVNINEGTLSYTSGLDKTFFGSEEININNATLDYLSNETMTFDKIINLKENATLNLTTPAEITITNEIKTTGANNITKLTNGTFILATALENYNGENNQLIFENTTAKISNTLPTFGNDKLNAQFNNSTLNLNNDKIDTLEFNEITFANTKLNVDIDLAGRDDQQSPTSGHTTDATIDNITANTGSGIAILDNIKIIQDGEWKDKILNIISAGTADIQLSIDNTTKRTEYTSGGYEYEIIKTDNELGSITINTTDYNLGEDTLKKAHIDADGKINRGFTVNTNAATQNGEYKTLSELGKMGIGTFNVKGLDKTQNSINANNLWTLFNIDSTDNLGSRTLTINDLTVKNATTENNTRKQGAAAYINGENSTLQTTNVLFANNTATTGGAVYNNNGQFNSTNTQFVQNIAQENGGAAYLNGNSTITNTTFDQNISTQNGGALYIKTGENIITTSAFQNNNAQTNGGAIYNQNDQTTITDTTFQNNIAANQGGAIYNTGILNIISTSQDSYTTFDNNKASNQLNDIYTTGTLNFKGQGTTYINSGIQGTTTSSINKDESGTLNLKGNNINYLGTTTINQGKIIFDKQQTQDTYLGGITIINGTPQNGGILELKLSTNYTLNGENKIQGTGTLQKTGQSDLIISGLNNAFEGNFNLTESNAYYNQTQENGYFGGSTTIVKNTTLYYNNTQNDLIKTLSGQGNFVKNEQGTLYLQGDNKNFTGITTINTGSLYYQKLNTTDNFLASIINLNNNSNLTFDLNYDEKINGNISSAETTTITKLGPSNLTLENDNTQIQSTLNIESGNVILSKQDDGDVYISGLTQISENAKLIFDLSTNMTYTGNNKIKGEGIWQLQTNPTATETPTLTLTGNNNEFEGLLNIESGIIRYEQSENGSYIGGITNIASGAKLEFVNEQNDNIHGLQGTTDSTFEKIGTGKVILDSDNSNYHGIVNINEGTLSFNVSDTTDKFFANDANVIIKENAELNLDVKENNTITINGNIQNAEYAKGIITKTSEGTLLITGDNKNYTGEFQIKEGITQYDQSATSTYFNGKTTIDPNAKLVLNLNEKTEAVTSINGSGVLEKIGNQTLEIKGDNSGFEGIVNIKEGIMSFDDLNNKFFNAEEINIQGTQTTPAKLEYKVNTQNSTVTAPINLNGNAEFELSGIANPDGTNKNIINVNDPATTTGNNNIATFSNGTFVFNNSYETYGQTGINNSLKFENATVELGKEITNFGNTGLNAIMENTIINMSNNGKINNITFNDLTLKNNVTYTIDLDLKGNPDQGSHVADPIADMIKYTTGTGTLKIENVAISMDGQWNDAEIQVLEGNGITLDMDERITAATSEEYEYAIKQSDVKGHENTHIKISTTDYISDPNAEDFSLKRMHTRTSPDPDKEIEATRTFTVVENKPDYKVLSNLDKMAEGTFSVNGAIDTEGNPTRSINGNKMWALFNPDSTDPTDNGKRVLNITGLKIYNASTANNTEKDGSAVRIAGENSTVNIQYTNFEINESEGKGGAIYNKDGTLSGINTNFTKNISGETGGAIYNASGTMNIVGSTMSENEAKEAGALYNAGTAQLENLNLEKNKAKEGEGGAIVNKETGKITITSANIKNNTAQGNGGAISNAGEMEITNAIITGNESESKGGAIYNTGELTLTNVSMSENKSKTETGGAIYNEGGKLTIEATEGTTVAFENNNANGKGNDIYTTNGLTIKTEDESSTVNITSGISGNGIMEKTGTGTLNLTGDNTNYNGDALISEGMLVYHKEEETDKYISGNTIIKEGATLVYNNKETETIAGKIQSETAGSGRFVKIGTGDLIITGDNSGFEGIAQYEEGNIQYTQTTGSKYFAGQSIINDGVKFVYESDNDGENGIERIGNFATMGSGTGEFVKEGTGTVELSGINKDYKGKITISEGELKYVQNDTSSYFGGTTQIEENANLRYESANDGINNIELLSAISGDGNFFKSGDGAVKISYDNSGFSGKVKIENGKLIYEKIRNKDSYVSGETEISADGELEFALKRDEELKSKISGNGIFTKSGDSVLTLSNDNSGFSGEVNLKEGTMRLGNGVEFFNANAFNMYSGTMLDLRNEEMNRINLGNLTLNEGVGNIGLDVDLANKTGDYISAKSVSGMGSLLIKEITVKTDVNYPGAQIQVIDTNGGLSNRVSLSSELNRVMGPIYQYEVKYDKTSGKLMFTGGIGGMLDYNPSVLMPIVAAQVGGYLTQLNTYEEAFGNMDMLMLMSKKDRIMYQNRNKYATEGELIYSPIMIPEENRGGWFRPYTTFETVRLKNGPSVSNVAYGGLAGVDSDIIHLKNGVDAVFTLYAGYNGSQQKALGSNITQNGGVLGGMAAFYKGNFFSGITANAGVSVADISTMYGRDDMTMLMSGVAIKSGYNWEIKDSRVIVQPNITMSYTNVNSFDYTNRLGVRISSEPLNAIQIAPGLKVIGNIGNGWQPYVGIAVMMSYMDKSKFYANEVNIPEMSVRPYVTYNVGLQKRWGDRFTGFIQTIIRTGGRNGVGLNAGLRWSF